MPLSGGHRRWGLNLSIDPRMENNPLGAAWRQYIAQDSRAPFGGKDLIRATVLAQRTRRLARFPTRSKHGVIRTDKDFQSQLLRRCALSPRN